MKVLSVSELRSNFSAVLKQVLSGEDIGVSFGRKKEPVAKLVPLTFIKKKRKIGNSGRKSNI